MADMPTCSQCKRPHWRFTACADAPDLPEPRVAVKEPFPIKSVPAGFSVWGDKLVTRDRNGWLIRDKG